MSNEHDKALKPEDLNRMLGERANAGDVDGIVALFEPNAVVASPPGQLTAGHEAIRTLFEGVIASGRKFGQAEHRSPIIAGDIAMTGITNRDDDGKPIQGSAEIARRQPDGSWLFVVDNPRVLPPS
ncbi:MAG: YybH family protein [Acidimicrobiales bacterium]